MVYSNSSETREDVPKGDAGNYRLAEYKRYEERLKELRKEKNRDKLLIKKLDYIDANIADRTDFNFKILKELVYLEMVGLDNNDSTAFFSSASVVADGAFRYRGRELFGWHFIYANIYKHFGLNIDEWFSKPLNEAMHLLEIAETKEKREAERNKELKEINSNITNSLNNITKNNK